MRSRNRSISPNVAVPMACASTVGGALTSELRLVHGVIDAQRVIAAVAGQWLDHLHGVELLRHEAVRDEREGLAQRR